MNFAPGQLRSKGSACNRIAAMQAMKSISKITRQFPAQTGKISWDLWKNSCLTTRPSSLATPHSRDRLNETPRRNSERLGKWTQRSKSGRIGSLSKKSTTSKRFHREREKGESCRILPSSPFLDKRRRKLLRTGNGIAETAPNRRLVFHG
jgi:hypothetical protein